jgi:hypothetical protein
MNEQNQNDQNPTPIEIEAPETERTFSNHRLCDGCGAALTRCRPQARFCSASCRTAARRTRRDHQLTKALAALEEALAALKGLVVRS